jgi:hypothetical protein
VSEFALALSPAADAYCQRIADDMVRLFRIARPEAIRRIERHWHGVPLLSEADYQLMTHQTTDDWACDIYYGKHSMWWRPGANPQPLPAPEPAEELDGAGPEG